MSQSIRTVFVGILALIGGSLGDGWAESVAFPLVDENSVVATKVPTDASDEPFWREMGFDDSAWLIGTMAVGFDSSFTNYGPLLNTDLIFEMRYASGSNYIRIPFDAPEAAYSSLVLRMRYDDGFVAYVNGVRVASANAPDELDHESLATASHPDAEAVHFVDFDVSAGIGALVPGANVLAIHGMNMSRASADYLIDARLVAEINEHPIPTTIQPIASIERTDDGIRFTMPPEFFCANVVMQYSADMSEGSWADIGTFVADDFSPPSFVDSDPARTGNASGYYRAVLRPSP